MDQIKTGGLIRRLRNDMHMTQRELAERIHVSDKAVSKWERGNGCPDISLLSELAEVFGTDIGVLLSGELGANGKENGNMKRIRFYVCPKCGNIITSASDASVTCCGGRLAALEPRKAEEHEMLRVEDLGGEWFLSSGHEMAKEHYISFVAYVNDSMVTIWKQYPEWNLQINLPLYRSGRLIWYCTKCGLLYQDLRRPLKKTDTSA